MVVSSMGRAWEVVFHPTVYAQAAPTLSSGQAAIAGTCELPAAAAQAQLSGKPELADSFDLGKSDATAKAMPAQMTNILVQVVPASQGNMLVGQAEGQLAPGTAHCPCGHTISTPDAGLSTDQCAEP